VPSGPPTKRGARSLRELRQFAMRLLLLRPIWGKSFIDGAGLRAARHLVAAEPGWRQVVAGTFWALESLGGDSIPGSATATNHSTMANVRRCRPFRRGATS
jgi:hypothetical protein